MADYTCPFCGFGITKENVLFVIDDPGYSYEDEKKYNFLMSCSVAYPLEDMKNFHGLYFRPTDDNVLKCDANGMPNTLSAYPDEGLTPAELEEDATAAGVAKPPRPAAPRAVGTRACPNCHCRLPVRFGMIPVIHVTLLGGRAAGKTAYLISLLQQLQTQLGNNALGTAKLLPESEAFMRPQIEYYVSHEGVTMPTPMERLFPLIIEYSYNNGEEKKQCYIAIHDIAGEGVTGDVGYLLNHEGVKRARTVLLMLDPNMLCKGAYDSASKLSSTVISADDADTASAYGEVEHDCCSDDIPSFLNEAVAKYVDFSLFQNVRHVVAVMTKLDQPLTIDETLFQGDKVLMKYDVGKAHLNRVNTAAMRRIEWEVRQYFGIKMNADVKALIANSFPVVGGKRVDVSLLAVSTYTCRVRQGKRVFCNEYDNVAPKHRIIEPLLAILAQENMIPTDAGEHGADVPAADSCKADTPPRKTGRLGRRRK